ncbi:MAG: carbamoyl phosphate synthase large subunit, partial [Ignavibacteriaceae bacterium]
ILKKMGLKFYGTEGTVKYYAMNNLNVEILYRPFDNKEPSILSYLNDGKIDLVINIPKSAEKVELDSDYIIRRKAVDLNIPLFTNVQATKRFINSLEQYKSEDLKIKSWDEYD